MCKWGIDLIWFDGLMNNIWPLAQFMGRTITSCPAKKNKEKSTGVHEYHYNHVIAYLQICNTYLSQSNSNTHIHPCCVLLEVLQALYGLRERERIQLSLNAYSKRRNSLSLIFYFFPPFFFHRHYLCSSQCKAKLCQECHNFLNTVPKVHTIRTGAWDVQVIRIPEENRWESDAGLLTDYTQQLPDSNICGCKQTGRGQEG